MSFVLRQRAFRAALRSHSDASRAARGLRITKPQEKCERNLLCVRKEMTMAETTQEKNKVCLLQGFELLFNQRSYEAARQN